MTPEALAALHGLCFTTPRPWTAAEFAALLDRSDIVLLTASGGFLLGSVVLEEAEVLTVAVDPEQRREGIARGLLDAFHRQVRDRGAERSLLEVGEDNRAARALYAAAGYRQTGRRRAYYRTPEGAPVDALVMDKALR